MNDAHGPLKLRIADASPVLDFVPARARPGLRMPLILLTVLVAAALALQGRQLWPQTEAAAVPGKSMKILAAAVDSGELPAPAQDNDRAQLAAVDQALADRQGKPVTVTMPAPHKMGNKVKNTGKAQADRESRPARRPALQSPSAVATVSAPALPARVELPEPAAPIVAHEVTLRNHVRLTSGALD